MASLSAPALGATSVVNVPASCSSAKSEIVGSGLPSLPQLGSFRTERGLKIEAKGGYGKISTKTPLGPGGGAKFRGGRDASGSKAKGKGVYQFTKKYGANVDGYSPIYAPDEWSRSGEVYAAGTGGLALWALTLGAILLAGGLLVYNTSALAQ